MARVVGIGLDGMEWSLVERMLDGDELPTLASVLARGSRARLHDADYQTGLSWEQFLTGKSAAGSGRFSAVAFDPSTYEVQQVGARAVAPFFATSPPVRTIAFDLPYMSLAPTADGVRVAGWGGHDPGYPRASDPPGLVRELDDVVGIHRALVDQYETVWYRPQALETIADSLVVGALRRADASIHLQRRFPDWDLFLTVMSESHTAGEEMWHGVSDTHPVSATASMPFARRRIREVYRAIDTAVGRMLEALPDGCIVVLFSMSGMHENPSDVTSMALLGELLLRLETGHSLLRAPDAHEWRAAGFPLLEPDPAMSWTKAVRTFFDLPASRPGARRRLVAHLPPTLRRVARAWKSPRTPAHPASKAAQRGAFSPVPEETELTPEQLGVPTYSLDWQPVMWYRPWWPQMRYFALPSFYDGRVRVNLRGRESAGIVAVEHYGAALDELEGHLAECRDFRTGRAAVADVVRLRADDPMSDEGPAEDLAIRWAEPCNALDHPTTGVIGPLPYRRTGGHTPDGFAVIAGPGIAPGDLGRRDARDVAATILSLLDRCPNPGIEGRAMIPAGVPQR